jgi:hypothetical protein
MQQTLAEKVYIRNYFTAIPGSVLEVWFHLLLVEGLLPFCGAKRDSGQMVGNPYVTGLWKGPSPALCQPAAAGTVREINTQTYDQPEEEADPSRARQTRHQEQAHRDS